ncbi:helix-turn-helix domain-containing protein [Alistipes timonensis]
MAKQYRNEKLIQAVGHYLRQLREERGLSQEKVTFQKNIYLTRIENGYRDITLNTLIRLCDAYQITLRDFFKGLNYEQAGD